MGISINDIYRDLGIQAINNNTRYYKFNRYKRRNPEEELEKMYHYIFFTKPDCHFFEPYSNGSTINPEIESLYQFNDILKFNKNIFTNLQLDQGGGGNFISYFSNNVVDIDANDRIIKTRDSVETPNDWKTVMGHRMNDSLAANTVNVSFRDVRSRLVFKTIEAWILYIDLITKGYITPTRTNRDDKILDYGGSIYHIVTSEDGSSIIHYCKYLNVFPLNIPDSAYGINNSNGLEYNIQFQYSCKDVTPAVVVDFNKINSYYKSQSYSKIQDKEGNWGKTWVSGYYIETTTSGYKLRAVE